MLESLITGISEGSRTALSSLYEHTKTPVYGFALSIVRDPHTAEDILQTTYIRIFSAAAGYRPMGKPMAWILTIVRNLSLMELRRSSPEVPFAPDSLRPPSSSGSPEERLDSMALSAVLQKLDYDERQIVVLHCVSGLKHRETAGLLDMGLSTVLSKYRRALKKLKNIITKEDGANA